MTVTLSEQMFNIEEVLNGVVHTVTIHEQAFQTWMKISIFHRGCTL